MPTPTPSVRFKTRPTILVVDDEPAVRQFLIEALTIHGYRTLEASDGTQVLPLVTAHAPALILLDLVMPNQEGLATITQLHKMGCPSKIIAMSGAFSGTFLHPAALLGAHATLAKPFTLDSLFDTLQALLQPSRSLAA